MLRPLRLGLLLAAILALVACNRHPVDESKALATVNGDKITDNDLTNYLQARGQSPLTNSPRERKAILDELISTRLLAQSAHKDKLEQDPNVYFALKQDRENILAGAAFEKYMQAHPITDSEIAQRYEQEARRTDATEYRLRGIQSTTEADANAVLQALHKGGDFATLARRRSADVASARKDGDMGWLNQGDLARVPEIHTALKGMSKGQVSPQPVKTDFGWYVFRLEDTRTTTLPTLEESKRNIAQLLRRERLQTLIGDLRKQATIKTE